MGENFIDVVYDLVTGNRIPQPNDPDVGNLFAIGCECERLYSEVYDANLRLCQRLGVEEDADIETIINSLLHINKLIASRMYCYGMEFGHK